ncbi:MAG: hypothetical protein K0R51_2562 [Cytophagaceae bacterium]|jgi:hypothetical protein|nr:hypothetical protein [Cytophagaceae bacterium]
MKNEYQKCIRGVTALLLTGIFFSCSKKTDDPNPSTFNGTKYTIVSGAHESTQQLVFKTTNELRFKAKFDSSAIYTTSDPLNQDDTNKLYGLSDCGSVNHQTNSARFGWRWFNNQLEIMSYCYIDGLRPEPVRVATVALNTVNSYSIAFKSDKYIFTVNDSSKVEVYKNCNYNSIRNKLYPYFGGDETAPHEIRIWIEEF